jgi:hypothetical protein
MGDNKYGESSMHHVSIQGHGNVIGGSNVHVSVVVDAAAESLQERGREDLANRLRALEEAVRRERDLLPDAAEVEDAVAMVASELDGTHKPSRLTLRGTLNQIALAARSATGVVKAAGALADAVQELF